MQTKKAPNMDTFHTFHAVLVVRYVNRILSNVLIVFENDTAQKVSVFGVILGRTLRGKMRIGITPNTDTFHAV